MNTFRRWCRLLHRHFSYLFAGVLIIYLVSGIAMNHKDTFNSQYDITLKRYTLHKPLPERENVTKEYLVNEVLKEIDEEKNYTKHYFPNSNTMKVFLKSGSNLVIDTRTSKVVYERVRRRPILGSMSRLHYNPGKAWTIFSDIFAAAMIIVVLSGLFMVKGKNGLIGIGGIEFAVGILLPLLFIVI